MIGSSRRTVLTTSAAAAAATTAPQVFAQAPQAGEPQGLPEGAPRPIGEERSALPCAARHYRPAGAVSRADREDRAFKGEAGQAGQRDAAAGNVGEADAGQPSTN
jgi:hypothetical protein